MDKIEIRMSVGMDQLSSLSNDSLGDLIQMAESIFDRRSFLLTNLGPSSTLAVLTMQSSAEACKLVRDRLGCSLLEAYHLTNMIREFRP